MNPAERILAIYDKLVSQGADKRTTTGHAWMVPFGLVPESPGVEDSVHACQLAFLAELDLLKAKLSALGAPSELFDHTHGRLRGAASPSVTAQPWRERIGNINSPDVRQPIAWAAWALSAMGGDDDVNATPQQLQALAQALAALEAALKADGISAFLRDFAQRQVSEIRQALTIYDIRGSTSIRAAIVKVAGDIALHSDELQPLSSAEGAEDARLFEGLGSVIGIAATASGMAAKFTSKTSNALGRPAPWLLRHFPPGDSKKDEK